MNYDTEYALKEFRWKQKEVFDENGKVFSGLGKCHLIAKEMLLLINALEKELQRIGDTTVIETHELDGVHWGISFGGSNPESKYYFEMPKDTALRLADFLKSGGNHEE